MEDIYLNTLNYRKTEVDDKFIAERVYTDGELLKKEDVVNKGAPGGYCPLNSSGKIDDSVFVVGYTGDVTISGTTLGFENGLLKTVT